MYPTDPGTGSREPFYDIEGAVRPYFAWSYPDQRVGRLLGSSQVPPLDDSMEQALDQEVNGILARWQHLLDDPDHLPRESDKESYERLLQFYAEINQQVELRRQQLVNCEGFMQNVLARGETLLGRQHSVLYEQLSSLRTTISQMGMEIESLREEKKSLSSEVTHLRQELGIVKTELTRSKSDKDSVTDSNVRLAEEFHSLQSQMNALRGDYRTLDKENETTS